MGERRKAKSVFLLAADLTGDARRAVIDEHCGDDAALRAEVESLLRFDPGHDALPAMETGRDGSRMQRQIGPYIVESLIAEGGSAAVYAARQESPARRVALKVLRRDAAGESWRRRFEREAEILASLDHPGIAHFYAFGRTPPPESRAYIAMELVEGETITAFAKRHGLTLTQRLELLIQACDAAEYGHRRGVVHRDLKPGNILVSLEPGRGADAARVRLVDFGVARLAQSGTEAPMTAAGVLIGTPAYMSPEQVSGGATVVDGRADVYALGVVLYEMACGRTPFGGEDSPPIELLHRILQEQPTRLGLMDTSLRGDIEIIAAKALARDLKMRYQTASELADDLRRFIQKRPILARRPSVGYVARTFVRRNRLLAVALAAAFVALVGAAGVAGWAAVTGREQARKMTREAEFWQGLAESMWRVPGTSRVRRELLDQIIPHLEEHLAKRPGDAATMRGLSKAYASRSDVEFEAQRLADCREWREKARRAAASAAKQTPRDPATLRELARVTILLGDLDKEDGADERMFRRYQEALSIHEELRSLVPDDPAIADDLYWSYQRLADQYRRCWEMDKAETMFALQCETGRKNHDRWPDDPRAIYAQSLALMQIAQRIEYSYEFIPQQAEEALVLARRLAAGEEAGKQHIKTFIQFSCWIAWRRHSCGRDAECEALLHECDTMLEGVRGPPGEEPLLDDAYVVVCMTRGNLLESFARYHEAEAMYRRCLPIVRAAAAAAPANGDRQAMVRAVEGLVREMAEAARAGGAAGRTD